MNKTKRLLALVLALVMSLTLFACGRKAQDDKTDDSTRTEDTTRVFTDSCGREVTVPTDIQKVAVSGPLAQMVVFAIAPDKMVGVANAWDETAENYFDQKYLDLPLLGQLYGGKGELNLETLLAADPDVVIDVGEPKSTMAEDLDGLQEQTGIPFVHIDAYLASMDDTYAMLSDLLAMPNEGQALADYCRNAYDTVKAIVDGVEKADVLYITGEEGLNVIARDSYHAEVVDMLCNNLAVVDEPSSKGTGNEVDMEQILPITRTGRPYLPSRTAGITRCPSALTTGWASRQASSASWVCSGWPRSCTPRLPITICMRSPRPISNCSTTAT